VELGIVVTIVLAVVAVVAVAVAVLTRGQALLEVQARFRTPLDLGAARTEGVPILLEAMAAEEFALSGVEDGRARFVRRYRPRWTIWVAALLWPLGLIALTRRSWIAVDVELQPADDGQGSIVLLDGTVSQRLWDRLEFALGRRQDQSPGQSQSQGPSQSQS
jgi:hypothetical protein